MTSNRKNSYRLNAIHLAAVLSGLIPIQALSAATSSVTLSANRNPATYGAPVILTAIISPGAATGKVTFFDGVAVLGIAPVVSGSAALKTVMIPAGLRLLKAHYSGDSLLSPSNSLSYPQMVNALPSGGFLPIRPFLSGGSGFFGVFALADFNGDGKLDVARTQNTSGVQVLLGNGDGTFTAVSKNIPGYPISSLSAGDFNGDGKMDLLATAGGLNGTTMTVYLGNGDGTFQALAPQSAGFFPEKPVLADFNGDGIIDLALTDLNDLNQPDAVTISIYLGKGDGTFGLPIPLSPGPAPSLAAAGDFNGDGITDLAVALADDWRIAGLGHVSILLGKGDGTFAPAVTYSHSRPLAVADFNGDGRQDLALGGSTVTILAGNGDGTFATSTVTGPDVVPDGASELLVLDVNGDGKPDLFAPGYSSQLKILVNTGDGHFTLRQTLGYNGYNFYYAVGDVNGDGIADIVTENGVIQGVPPANLEVTLAPNGTIQLGQKGATFSIAIRDAGSTSTSGITTASYNPPKDFVFVGMSGAGWTCSGYQCQRTDTLSPGQSYPPITVTVDVSNTAAPAETHSATVSTNTGITATATAAVSIVYPPPFDLTISMSHSGNFQPGQLAAPFSITVSNLGPNASGGIVMVSATAPSDFSNVYLTGPGWGCNVDTCQRSDALPAGQSYPSITATISVSVFAASIVTTTATVTAFLDSNPANNRATDSVIVFRTQTIGFGPIQSHSLSESSLHLNAVATSGLPVIYAASGNCSVAENTVMLLAVGTCTITASQSGSVTFSAAADVRRSFPILANASSVTLNAASSSSVFGAAVKLTATVAPASATGKVAFYDGVSVLGLAPVVDGVATLSPALNATGKRTLAAHYTGDKDYPGSTAAGVSHQVTAVPSFNFKSSIQSVFLGTGAAVGDLNGDGHPDIVTDSGVLLSNGDGTFGRPTPLPFRPSWFVVADFNGDGRLDLAAVHAFRGAGVYFLPGKGDGTFGAEVKLSSTYGPLVVGDFNVDGIADVGVVHSETGAVEILLGNGDGTFSKLGEFFLGEGLRSVLVGDLNGDGVPDLVSVLLNFDTVPQHPKIVALLGNGDGSFGRPLSQLVSTARYGYLFSFALDDLNGDGKPDLLVGANFGDPPFVALGNGDGTFGTPYYPSGPGAGGDPVAILAADFNGDGSEDVIPISGSSGTASVFFGNGDGALQSPATFSLVGSGSLSAPIPIADLNGDGRVDFVTRDARAGLVIVQGTPGASLRISAAHSGNFVPLQAGTFTIRVDNAPDAANTGGAVTVAITMSVFFAYYSVAGDGWSCSEGTCMRTDQLIPGASYPPITITYNVPAQPDSTVILSATVSGGGSLSRTTTDTAQVGSIPSNCTYAFASILIAPAGGGQGSLSLTTQPGCPWSVGDTSLTPWLGIDHSTIDGSATIPYTVSANNTGSARSAGFFLGTPLSVFGAITILQANASSVNLDVTQGAPGADTSGNSLLSGADFFRTVLIISGGAPGYIARWITLFGKITFDGNGKYSIDGAISDALGFHTATNPGAQPFTATGVYSISAGGIGMIQHPLLTGANILGGVANGVFVGSTTEIGVADLFVAAPAGNAPATSQTLKGNYVLAHMDLSTSVPDFVKDCWIQMTANGIGNLITFDVTGSIGASSTPLHQNLAGATYLFSNGVATLNLGPPAGNTNLVGGEKLLYTTPDGEFVFGGSATGADLFVGVRQAVTPPAFTGLFYQAGLIEDESKGKGDLRGFWGALVVPVPGIILDHQRRAPILGSGPYHFTHTESFTMSSDGTYRKADGTARYAFTSSGAIRVGFGVGPVLGIEAAVQAPAFSGTGVYLNPTGVQNAASYALFTAGVAPGELITINGTNLTDSPAAATSPFPLSLNNVAVLINGRPAPICYVTASTLAVVVPYGTTGPTASIQVVKNGSQSSNTISVFVNRTAPGLFTLTADGRGSLAALHAAGYSVVRSTNPAQAGEAVSLFLVGLGAVTPQVVDGAIGPVNPLSKANQVITVSIGGVPAAVSYAGLAPYLSGVYQINVTVPAGVPPGDALVTIAGPDFVTAQATLPVH